MPRRSLMALGVTLVAVLWFVGYGFYEGFRAFPARVIQSGEGTEVAHLPLVDVSPQEVRAVYATAATVSVPAFVDRLVTLIKTTELNALVVNVKDGDGTYLGPNMERLAKRLRSEGIYPIARVVVFQDNALARERPDLALHDAEGNLWASGGGKYLWVDPTSREVWERNVAVAVGALDEGFSEVNFDYIRFPSDGNVQDVVFPYYDGSRPASAEMKDFYAYLTSHIRSERPGAILSIDLFAFSFLRDDGLGVGQRVGDAAQYFDVVSPMIYPSHYSPGNFEFVNPAGQPYEVVRRTLESGKVFLAAASSTALVRPWVQDFDIGAIYDAHMVREEIRAVVDAGFRDTWMVWNPANVYEEGKFLPEAK